MKELFLVKAATVPPCSSSKDRALLHKATLEVNLLKERVKLAAGTHFLKCPLLASAFR